MFDLTDMILSATFGAFSGLLLECVKNKDVHPIGAIAVWFLLLVVGVGLIYIRHMS